MKLKNILEDIISEGASDIMYHFISPKYILDILQNDRLNTIAAMGDDSDFAVNKNKFYYLSTTRSRSSGYRQAAGKLVLDGRKLKQRYEFAPVDYFQKSKSDTSFSYINNMKTLEQEDRIITDKPSIPNARKYILEIHIYVNTSQQNDIFTQKIIELCEKYEIKIFLYDKLIKFYNQRNPIDINKFKNMQFGGDVNSSDGALNVYAIRHFNAIAYLLSFNNDDLYETITRFVDNTGDIKEFDEGFKNFKKRYLEDDSKWSPNELAQSIKANISSIQSDSTKDARFILDLLRKDLRKNKVTTIEDYVKLKVS
jgi:hypothetical protein